MGEDPDKARLDSLSARLKQARTGQDDSRAEGSQSKKAMSYGLRMGVELVAAVLVGAGMGWLLDRWFGTSPWLLILFFLFGVAAGFRNVQRASMEMSQTDENSSDAK
ncbi:AtpZ/AtpI family protein [Pedomonas sp. V897]|uniref:AtpZ/AtpI family protein n=1 Tax=Pedomonas sp. V897 TaxID=3446482 RepID=UPI003EE0F087